MKPVRSVLYTPGHRRELIERAPDFGSDALCLVLEDSVPDDTKQEAREIVQAVIPALSGSGETVFVKVNSLDSEFLARDLDSIAVPGLAGVILPEARTVADVVRVSEMLDDAEKSHGLSAPIDLLLLIETANGLRTAFDLASVTPRTKSLISGHGKNGDMARDLGYSWTVEGGERLYIRSKLLVDARSAGCHPMDGVFMHVDDLDGLVREAEFSRQLGYRGKLAVAPRQVEPINRVFTPTEREVEYFQKVVDTFESALQGGSAAFLEGGEFIDYAPYETAKAAIEFATVVGTRPD